ncbi:hypothetical protein [Deinococcus sp.]|uniref:hypothetical protein n=1 Tax=Deinococcus sp. TaxID=47478 RepID=UPI003C79800D
MTKAVTRQVFFRLLFVILGCFWVGVSSQGSAETMAPLLPEQGAVIRSGGLLSESRLVIYDQHQGTVRYVVSSARAFISPTTPLSAPLYLTILQQRKINAELVLLGRAKDLRPYMAAHATADWDVLLEIYQDGKQTSIQVFGPPRSTLKELYEYLWGIIEDEGH